MAGTILTGRARNRRSRRLTRSPASRVLIC